MPDFWRPIHENHAIDTMAAVVQFANPLPDLLFNKVLRLGEKAAFANDLRSRHGIRGILFSADASGAPLEMPVVQGQIFNRTQEGEENSPTLPKLAEQLRIDQNSLVYRTWDYISWTWQRERMRKFTAEVLDTIEGVVAVGTLRLEYLDRFSCERSKAQPDLLFRKDGKYLAPHGFETMGLWHSHTGFVLPQQEGTVRVQQVNVDMLDDPTPDQAHLRWANITTAREDRLGQPSVDDLGVDANMIFTRFDAMHDDLVSNLGKIITKEAAESIGLKVDI